MIAQFPHCDSYILHAAGECKYCDEHPEWQELRMAWGIAFTGHSRELRPVGVDYLRLEGPVLPCPADYTRPPGGESDHRRWGGNKPTSAQGDSSWPAESNASVFFYGDQGGRA